MSEPCRVISRGISKIVMVDGAFSTGRGWLEERRSTDAVSHICT